VTKRYSRLRKRIGKTSHDILKALKKEMMLLENISDVLDELNALKIVYKEQNDLDIWIHENDKARQHKPLDDVNLLINEAERVRRSVRMTHTQP
jgi:hypothetical protein